MKNSLLTSLKQFLSDRTLASLAIGLILLATGYALYVGFTLEPSDLQVATRYTAFGSTHFYRTKWYYLISFAFFGILLAAVHIALAVKLNSRGSRQLAIFLMAITALLFVIAFTVARSVLQIAFL